MKKFWKLLCFFLKEKKGYILPALALAAIAGGVTAALAVTNALTTDIITSNAEQEAVALRKQVMPETADTFEAFTGLELADGDTCHVAKAGGQVVGYVFTVQSKGNSAGLQVMTGVTVDGTIFGVEVPQNNETKTYFDKLTNAGYFARYKGRVVGSTEAEPDVISGATKSSRGVTAGVEKAIGYFKKIGGGQ